MLVKAYGDQTLSEAICKIGFQRFRDNDFGDQEKRLKTPKCKQYWLKMIL